MRVSNRAIELETKKYVFSCPENQYIIFSNQSDRFHLLSIYCSRLIKNFASMVIDGLVEQQYVIGLNDNLEEKLFAFLYLVFSKSYPHNNQFGEYHE